MNQCWKFIVLAWWFGTSFIFPFSWEQSSQLTFIFFRGVETTKIVNIIAWKPAGGDRLVNWLETRSD